MNDISEVQESLFELASILSQQNDFSEILRVISNKTARLFNAEVASIVMINPSTTIEYSIPSEVKNETSNVKKVLLKVYDILGNEIATLVNENKRPGNYEIKFDGLELSSGIYFYKLQAGEFVETKKMILMK